MAYGGSAKSCIAEKAEGVCRRVEAVKSTPERRSQHVGAIFYNTEGEEKYIGRGRRYAIPAYELVFFVVEIESEACRRRLNAFQTTKCFYRESTSASSDIDHADKHDDGNEKYRAPGETR